MVTKCCVKGCNTKAGQSIKLHRIPKGDIGDVWIQFFKKFNPLFKTSKNSVVCGLHFTDLDYACSSTSLCQTMMLKKNAVPSIISSYVPRSLIYNEPPPIIVENESDRQSAIVPLSVDEEIVTLSLSDLSSEPAISTLCSPPKMSPSTSFEMYSPITPVSIVQNSDTQKSSSIKKRKCFMGDFKVLDDINSPNSRLKYWIASQSTVTNQKKRIKFLQKQNDSLKSKISTFKNLVDNLTSDNCFTVLKDIRSFFSNNCKKNDLNKTKSSIQIKKPKKRHILSSDDEDDMVPCTPVNNKQKLTLPEKRKLCNPVDIFGSEPVKQSPIQIHKPNKKNQVVLNEEEIDIEWDELDNIEKQFINTIDVAGTSKKSSDQSHISVTPEKSPANHKGLRTSTKESPTHHNTLKTSINTSPKVDDLVKSKMSLSPAKILKTTSVVQKSPSVSPKNEKLKNNIPNKMFEPLKKKLDIFDDDINIIKTGIKRKFSPIKTPENKKIKVNTVQSPDTQESGYSSDTFQSINISNIPVESKLWVEKYKPVTLKQIIGQTGEKSNVNKLLYWLKSWYSNHGVGVNTKLTRPSPWAKDDNGAFFKAALLSGSPGVGKTTTAHLVCKELGFDIVEFNASDTRSKKQLQNHVSELLSSTSLSPFLNGKSVTKKHVLLMDEVDGMAGNEDRGGVQELIILIKNAKCPVLCMCNDRNHPKIRTLSNYCFDLRFHKPKLEQIKAAMMSVCYKEKLKIPSETLSSIIASTDNDIRLTLNHLSIVAAGQDNLNLNKKYVKMGPWDVVRKVFSAAEHKSMNINDKCDLFFYDYNISPLFVQENYLSAVPHDIEGPKWKTFECYSLAADSICTGDIVSSKIRSTNNWSLLPAQAIFSSYCPGEFLRGHIAKQINFPCWLGKFSKGNKMNRLLQEVQIHTRIRLSASKEAINLDYLTTLRDSILKPLLNEGSDGVQKSLDFMNHYHLVKDDVESLNELSTWPGHKDPMSDIPAKVKSAFTRAYNKIAPAFSVSKKNKKTLNDADGLLDDDETNAISEEDDDDITNDALISIVKKKAGKNPTTPTTKETNKGRGGSIRGRKKK